ncbi:hypothetical protein Tco_0380084, partial [Tanacetum coccineum]
MTLKGDDIEAYNNRFHELDLMCPELVPTKKKKIEKYIRGVFLKESKEISLLQNLQLCMMPSTWHVNWLSKQFRVGLPELGKAIKKWEDHQRNTNNNNNNPNNNNNNNHNNRNRNNNYHQQQNKRQETARAYAAAPTE